MARHCLYHWTPRTEEWKRCSAKRREACPYRQHGWGKLKLMAHPTLFDLP